MDMAAANLASLSGSSKTFNLVNIKVGDLISEKGVEPSSYLQGFAPAL